MPTTVAVLAHEQLNPFHLSVPGAVFGELRQASGITDWDVVLCAAERGRVSTSDGYDIQVDRGLTDLLAADVVVVPSWRDPYEDAPSELTDALREAHARGALVVGLCLGAFVVAGTGLLDGRRATTHWRATDVLAERFPKVTVDPAVLYIDEGDVITSAGTAASLDACLHVVRARLGSRVANQVARGLVVSPHREGGQAQFVDRPVPERDRADPLAGVLDWALAHLADDLDVDELAARAHMSRRTFTRSFGAYTGTTPARWVRAQRLREAQRLLETTSQSIERVASSVGFSSAVTLRENFVSEFGVSPLRYRRAFAARTV